MFPSRTANRPRWFWRLTLLALTLALAVGAVLWRTLETAAITDIQARIEALKTAFTVIRWSLIGLVVVFWREITDKLYRLGRIDASRKNQLLALRWRVLSWLVLFELVLGQNLLGRFLQAIRGVGV